MFKSISWVSDLKIKINQIGNYRNNDVFVCKVNSVQEAWAKCFEVHLSNLEILQTTWKTTTTSKYAKTIGEKMKTKSLIFFVSFFCKISNSNIWTAKHLAQASWTELTLHIRKYRLQLTVTLNLEKTKPTQFPKFLANKYLSE